MTRRIAVPIIDRANFGRLLPVLRAIQAHPELELQIIASGTTLLDRFGRTENHITQEGFEIATRVYVEVEGGQPVTMAKSIGFCIIEASTALNNLQPDAVLLIGDRYEALGFAIASAYQNIPLAHIQGGEISGSIDESTRHAITKFSQFHFASTEKAKSIIIQLGENPQHVYNSGCPVGDIILPMDKTLASNTFANGVGASIDPNQPYALVIFHPITTAFETQEEQCQRLLAAMEKLHMPTIWLWPNIDAGGDLISKTLRYYRELKPDNNWLRMIKGFPPQTYQKVLANATIAIGNSSSFVRDSSFTGTPVLIVGDRQQDREHAANVVHVTNESSAIINAAKHHLEHGPYPVSTLYGTGQAGPFIAEKLANVPLYVQKKLNAISLAGL